jgi:hypothetical protein
MTEATLEDREVQAAAIDAICRSANSTPEYEPR